MGSLFSVICAKRNRRIWCTRSHEQKQKEESEERWGRTAYCPSAFPFSGMRATTFRAHTSSGARETQRHYTQDQMFEGNQKLHKMLYLLSIQVN